VERPGWWPGAATGSLEERCSLTGKLGRLEEKCSLTRNLVSLRSRPWGWRVLPKWLRMRVLPGDRAKGQVGEREGCEEKYLQGGRGSLWLQVGGRRGLWEAPGGCAAADTSPGARAGARPPGPAASPEPLRGGGREAAGRGGGRRRWEPAPRARCGAGGEAAPGEGRRRGGREGMLLNSFLP